MIDLGPTRIIASRTDGPWAAAADLALAVAGVEIALTRGAVWALPAVIALVYLAIGQLAIFRYRIMSAALELRAAAGVLALAVFLAALVRPVPWVAVAACGAVGAVKLARETIVYFRLKRAMLAEGKIRRVSRQRLAVFSGLAGGALAIIVSLAGEAPSLAVAYAAWVAAYFACSAAIELVA